MLCHCLSMPPSKVCRTSSSHSLSYHITSSIISQLYVLLIHNSNNNNFAYINHHIASMSTIYINHRVIEIQYLSGQPHEPSWHCTLLLIILHQCQLHQPSYHINVNYISHHITSQLLLLYYYYYY
jgi:hypothetical protein